MHLDWAIFWFSVTFQVLLPPYEEAISIPPKEPPPQYMEAWETSLLLDPIPQASPNTNWNMLKNKKKQRLVSVWIPANPRLHYPPFPVTYFRPLSRLLCPPPRTVSKQLHPLPAAATTNPPPWQAAVPWQRLNSCTPWTLCPNIICTFLWVKRASVWPPTVNPQYCESPSWSLSRNKLPEERAGQRVRRRTTCTISYARALFFRNWRSPSLNVKSRYFCMTFCITVENWEKMKWILKGCPVVIKYNLCADVACPAGNHIGKRFLDQ